MKQHWMNKKETNSNIIEWKLLGDSLNSILAHTSRNWIVDLVVVVPVTIRNASNCTRQRDDMVKANQRILNQRLNCKKKKNRQIYAIAFYFGLIKWNWIQHYSISFSFNGNTEFVNRFQFQKQIEKILRGFFANGRASERDEDGLKEWKRDW